MAIRDLDTATLMAAHGGVRIEEFRESVNVEDRRPVSHGNPAGGDAEQMPSNEF